MANKDDEQPQDDPSAPKPTKAKPGTLITAQTYEAMWEVYRDGQRTKGELERRFNISRPTAYKAIEKGWPERGFLSLKQRAREHDMQRTEAERQAALDKHKEATDAWYRAGKQFNRVADNAVTFCILALQQISQLATVRTPNGVQLKPLTKWVRRKDVQVDNEGKRTVRYYDEEVPLTTSEAVKLEASVLKAAGMASAFKRVWPTTTDEQKAEQGPPTGLAALTVEQIDHIIKTGQLPPGVTAEDVWGYEVPGFPSKKSGRGPN